MGSHSPLNTRPIYTEGQLSEYLTFIYGPSHQYSNPETLRNAIKADPIDALSSLGMHHLIKVPWGNVALQYSPTKKLSLDSEALFQKIVVRKLGGYCMEMNTFYSAVLRSLGVQLYNTGGRISNAVAAMDQDPNGFAGW